MHGPGCPVCVTPLELIDKALAIAARPDVIFCSFGDMLRVPGSRRRPARGQGRAAATCASSTRRSTPLALARAQPRPRGRVLRRRLRDHRAGQRDGRATRRSAQGLDELLAAGLARARAAGDGGASSPRPTNRVQGFLAAGHVCTVMGYRGVRAARRAATTCRSSSPASSRSTSCRASYMCVQQLEEGRAEVENQYARVGAARRQRAGAAR